MSLAQLNALIGDNSGLGRRTYDRFASLVLEKGMVDEPFKAILPNAEAIDPFKVPMGNVLELPANAPLVSELLHRPPVSAISFIELKDSQVNTGNLASITEKLKALAPEFLSSKETFSLLTGDNVHWEADLVSGRLSVFRTRHVVEKHNQYNRNLHNQAHRKGAKQPSYLQSALMEAQPTYSYALVAISEVSPKLMEEYTYLIEATCQNVGQMADHPATKSIQSFLVRNNNRLLYQIGEKMGWSFPCQVDSSSTFYNQAEYSAPLLAVPTHTQLNNTIKLMESLVDNNLTNIVRIYNGAIDMLPSAGELRSAFVDLGPDVGIAQFTAPVRRAALALPVSVRREAAGRKFDTLNPNLGTFVGSTASPMFKQGYYQKPTEEFMETCQKLAGNTDEISVDPCIFTPVLNIVGEWYGDR